MAGVCTVSHMICTLPCCALFCCVIKYNTLTPAWISYHIIIKYVKIIHFQTSMVQPLTFGNELVILLDTLLGI